MQYVLDLLVWLSKMKDKISIEIDEARLRPSDVPVLWGDNTKFMKQTGWRPEIHFKTTMQDLLDYWRGRVS